MSKKEKPLTIQQTEATKNWRGELAAVQLQDIADAEWVELGENGGENGSLVAIAEPDRWEHLRATQFKPGHKGGPGRPKRKQEEAFIDAAADVFSPAEYTFYLRKALEIALDNNSTRGIILVLNHIRDTAFGRPQQRVRKDVNNFHHLVQTLLDGKEPAGDDGEQP